MLNSSNQTKGKKILVHVEKKEKKAKNFGHSRGQYSS